jgi:hypothetical protein
VAYRWVEVKIEAGRGDKATWRRRKLLVAEKAFREGRPLEECVAECYHQDSGDRTVVRLPARRVHSFLGMGVPAASGALHEAPNKEEVTTGLGKLLAKHSWAAGKVGEVVREYHGWLSGEVPFGLAKLEIREKRGDKPAAVIFSAVATRKGDGARSEVDESAAR